MAVSLFPGRSHQSITMHLFEFGLMFTCTLSILNMVTETLSAFVKIKHIFFNPAGVCDYLDNFRVCHCSGSILLFTITKTCLFKHTENFTTKKWKFADKKFWYFHISAQNIDCGYSLELPQWDSSNEYPQSMFLSRNKKNNVYPYKPFYYIKVGLKGVKII